MKAMPARKSFSSILGMENRFRPMRSAGSVPASAGPAARADSAARAATEYETKSRLFMDDLRESRICASAGPDGCNALHLSDFNLLAHVDPTLTGLTALNHRLDESHATQGGRDRRGRGERGLPSASVLADIARKRSVEVGKCLDEALGVPGGCAAHCPGSRVQRRAVASRS